MKEVLPEELPLQMPAEAAIVEPEAEVEKEAAE